MGTANFSAMKKARWRESLCDDFTDTVRMMTEPFTIDSLYPVREVERPKDSGQFIEVQSAMPHQQVYHAKKTPSGKTPKFILLNGGVGAGKSVAAAVEILWLLKSYPGLQVVVVAAFDYYFDEFFLPVWASIVDDDPETNPFIKSKNQKSRTTWFTNGSVLRLKAYDDAERIKGWQAHVIFITEAGLLGDRFNQKARAIYNALCERLRGQGRHFPLRIYLDQNPEGHNWSWELFVKPNKLGDVGKVTKIPPNDWYPRGTEYAEYEHTTANGDTYYCLSMGTSANPFNPPGYLDTMVDMRNEDPATMARKIGGSFTPVHALIYENYCSTETHVVPIEKVLAYWSDFITRDTEGYVGVDCLPRDWPIHVGIDVAGASSPWAIEIYVETPVDDNGNTQILAIDEIYCKGFNWHEMAEKIKERTDDKGWKNVRYWIDPHSGNQKQGANQQSVIEEFRELGIPCNIPRNYTKWPAIMRVREMLRRDEKKPHPYMQDDWIADESVPGAGKYGKGASMLYYVSSPDYVDERRADVPGSRDNPQGIINWYNLKEKEVYRLDSTKERQVKENEEGLQKIGPEKVVDRDDHAQTAEMFVVLGIRPLPRIGKDRPRRHVIDKPSRSYETETARSGLRRR